MAKFIYFILNLIIVKAYAQAFHDSVKTIPKDTAFQGIVINQCSGIGKKSNVGHRIVNLLTVKTILHSDTLYVVIPPTHDNYFKTGDSVNFNVEPYKMNFEINTCRQNKRYKIVTLFK